MTYQIKDTSEKDITEKTAKVFTQLKRHMRRKKRMGKTIPSNEMISLHIYT